MKITGIKTFILKQHEEIKLIGDGSQDTILIRVDTDEGISGWGEVDSSPYIVDVIINCPTSHSVCRGLKDAVIGQDPFDIEKIWYDMYAISFYYGRRSVAIHAMSGIDMAIWDILGKAVGKPIYKLLGGKYHDNIKAYASLLMPDTAKEVKQKAQEYLDRGFRGIKFGWGALGTSKAKDIELVGAAREAIGDRFLMLDIGYIWKNGKYAVEMCKALEQFNPYWIEEPVISDDISGLRKVSDSTSIKIASGEELTTLYEYKQLIKEAKIDIVQPDMSRCGGLTIAKKISDMALSEGIDFVPHAFKSGVLMAATIQMLAAYRGDALLEYCCQETVLSKKLLKKHFEVDKDGYVKVPDAPGLGIEIDMDAVKKYRVK